MYAYLLHSQARHVSTSLYDTYIYECTFYTDTLDQVKLIFNIESDYLKLDYFIWYPQEAELMIEYPLKTIQ